MNTRSGRSQLIRPRFVTSCSSGVHRQVLVPCFSSWSGDGSFADSQFDSYVLQPVEDGYQTADGKVGAAFGSLNSDKDQLGLYFLHPGLLGKVLQNIKIENY